MSLGGAYGLALGLAVGAAVGALHFGALGLAVRCFAGGRALRAATLQAARFALVAAALLGLVQLGAGPLLTGLLGLLGARQVLLRRMGGVP